MGIVIILLVIGIIILLHYLSDTDFVKVKYSIHQGNEYLGLRFDGPPKYLIHKVESIYGYEYMLSFIGKEGDHIGFDTIGEAEERIRDIKRGKI